MRLTQRQYWAILGQEAHLWRALPAILDHAASRVNDESIRDWLRRYAATGMEQAAWAEQLLSESGGGPVAATLATRQLLEQARAVATGPRPWAILALCDVLESRTPTAQQFGSCSGEVLADDIVRRQQDDIGHGEVSRLIAALPMTQQLQARQAALSFAQLFVRFLTGAVHRAAPPNQAVA